MTAADRDRIRRMVDQAKRQRVRRSRMKRDDQLDQAAYALFRMAGRPDGLWDDLTEVEKRAFRECFLVALDAFMGADEAAA